ncbi:MAG: T9SS type A sorting domain-containing protein, partial [Lewinella sp.]|nr:T9SS type A sorting domain-containing protein [Lewinella sp.]
GFLPVTTFDIVIDEDAVVNTETPEPAPAFRIFPNPTRDLLTVECPQGIAKDTPVQLFNLQGQLLQQWTLQPGDRQLQVSLANLPAGLYALRIGQQLEKVLKQ